MAISILHTRMAEVTKPTDPDGLILEAWAQGYMVGALTIMISITMCNIRRGVLLHKLILLEVCTSHPLSLVFETLLTILPAYLRAISWHFYIQPCSSLWLVFIRNCDISEHILESS